MESSCEVLGRLWDSLGGLEGPRGSWGSLGESLKEDLGQLWGGLRALGKVLGTLGRLRVGTGGALGILGGALGALGALGGALGEPLGGLSAPNAMLVDVSAFWKSTRPNPNQRNSTVAKLDQGCFLCVVSPILLISSSVANSQENI